MKLIFEQSLTEMAMSRTDAIDRCQSLGKQFITHFDKIYNESDKEVRSHWESEMNTFWEKVKDIKLKGNKNSLSFSNLHDWFFTACQNAEDFMTAEDKEAEEELYNNFIIGLHQNRNKQVSEVLSQLLS